MSYFNFVFIKLQQLEYSFRIGTYVMLKKIQLDLTLTCM